MSASTEKKIRQANREAGTDKKAIAAKEEAAKKAKSKLKWTVGTVIAIVLIALVLFLDSSYLNTSSTAVEIGSARYTPAQLSFGYAGQYINFASSYGSYASVFGLDTSTGIQGLRNQSCPMLGEEGSWRDYFLEAAETELLQTKALADYAEANGIVITDEDKAGIEENLASLEEIAESAGYSSVDKYLSANYGKGVDRAVVEKATYDNYLASKAYSEKLSSLEYTDAELEEKYASYNGDQDTYSYAYVLISADTEAGETAAETKAKGDAIVEAYTAAEGEDFFANFSAAAEAEGFSANRGSGAKVNLSSGYSEWLTSAHQEGAAAALVPADSENCYVVLYLGSSDNHYNTAQVRHILVKAAADENGEYTDAAKAEAKAKAEDILAQWKAGEATEDSFAALAEELSEDSGSNTNGGLYDSVVKGQMVEEFDAFCFEGHESGDTAVVYGESSGYAGYHVMYYVGEGELYSNTIARDDLRNTDITSWFEELCSAYEVKEGFGVKLVG